MLALFLMTAMQLQGPTLDGSTYKSLAACYAAVTDGGPCIIPSGYKETLSQDLTLNKSGAGFFCLGSCTIIMLEHQIIVPTGTYGVFLKGLVPYGGNANVEGFHFIYSG